MPRSRAQPGFRKVRADHAIETAEDYLEAIGGIVQERGVCRVKDLADHMGVSHVTVVKIIARLQGQGLVDTAPYQPITLTPLGGRLAEATRRRHEIVLAFLLALGVPRAEAERDAEGIEHHVSAATLSRMEAYLRDAGDI